MVTEPKRKGSSIVFRVFSFEVVKKVHHGAIQHENLIFENLAYKYSLLQKVIEKKSKALTVVCYYRLIGVKNDLADKKVLCMSHRTVTDGVCTVTRYLLNVSVKADCGDMQSHTPYLHISPLNTPLWSLCITSSSPKICALLCQ